MELEPNGAPHFIDLMTRVKEEISPTEGTTINVEELVQRLKSVNIHISEEECCLVLNHLIPLSHVNRQQITREEFSQLFDALDNRLAIRILFEKYSVPMLNQMGPEQLKTFFCKEQEKTRSTRFCRHLIDNVNQQLYGQCSISKLTLAGFYRVLALDMFRLFNQEHDKPCQSMNFPLTHYYVATSQHIKYPLDEQDILQRKYPEIQKSRPSLSFEKSTVLAKYRDLLFTGCRCLQVKLVWNNDYKCFCIPIQLLDSTHIYLELDDFLNEVYWAAFKHGNPNPVILQFSSEHLRDKQHLLYQRVYSKFQASLYKPLPKLTKFPSVKKLQNKFLVYYIVSEGKESLQVGTLLTGDARTKAPNDEECIDLEELHDDRTKVSFWESFSAECSQVMCQIERSVALGESERNNWPTVTERNLTSLHCDDEVHPGQRSSVAVKLIQVGVQLIPVAPENVIARALFRLNGNCGYVAKPNYLRKGALYKRFSEDKPLKDELPSCLFNFMMRIICTSPLDMAHFQGGMKTKVTMQIVGHDEDAKHRFTTKVCSSDGLVPFWNEQTRFRIRVPDLAFFYFEVHNNSQLIGYHAIPVKAILKGNRHVQLYGRDHQPIDNAKLFLHIDYKMITRGWKPAGPEPVSEEPVETVSIPL